MESVQERMQRLGTKNKIAYFIAKEKEPYEFKRRYARIRAEEFARECDGRELNYHVSVVPYVGGTSRCNMKKALDIKEDELKFEIKAERMNGKQN